MHADNEAQGNVKPAVVYNRDLVPAWGLKQAKEAGFLRSLTTWVGGPEGHVNSNRETSIVTDRSVVGLMRMAVGNRQPGVHVHSVTEIYVIVKGEVESFDGVGNTHRAGPLECLYIPAGVPHGVRAIGDEDLELVWVHDAIEAEGVSRYLDGPGPYPADREVELIRFRDLHPHWPRNQEGGSWHWAVNWVGGYDSPLNHNPGVAAVNENTALGLTVVMPWNCLPPQSQSHDLTYVVLRGEAVVQAEGSSLSLGRLDALRYPAGCRQELRNVGESPLFLLWVSDSQGSGQ